jgi:hypothetical protein
MADILSATELANLRADLGGLLTDRCDVKRTTEVDDEYGGQTVEENTIAANVPILVTATRGRTAVGVTYSGNAAKLLETAAYQLTFPYSVDLQIGDIVIITSLENLRLRITAIITAESLEVVKQAGGEELRED